MSRPKIKTALTAVLLVLGTAFLLFSGFALDRLSAINDNVISIATNNLPTFEAVKDMEVQLGEMRIAYRSHILRADPEGKAAASTSIEAAVAQIAKDVDQYRKLGPSPEEAALLTSVEKAVSDYNAAGKEVLAFSLQGKIDDANAVLRNTLSKTSESARATIKQMLDIARHDTAVDYAAAGASYAETFTTALVATGLLVLIVAGAIWFALTGIAKPIGTITESMKILAEGNSDRPVPFSGRKDEIGEMAAAVETFRQTAIAKIASDRQASETRQTSEAERIRSAETERLRAEEMAHATTSLAEGLKYLSQGDLTFELSQAFAADFEGLRNDFNQAVGQLRETLGQVATATSAIDGGSRELSQSAGDLSKRTEQQAASLEETAAALDQITVNVGNSSRRTEEARAMAIDANKSARQSGEVVANAVNAMQRIEQSSSQISNIIGVIDEIAFQTNLLALNAGVEAARAGEAGKGFAVVAQEVRELAQRSAKAAKEIKELIRTSADEVGNGVRLVTATGDALKVIEDHVVAINTQLDAIATSAREQSVGLTEVNTAVNQMDQVTQQNAAMVEEANAASSTLAGEADKLRNLISRFQLGSTGQMSSGYARPASTRPSAPKAASTYAPPVASPALKMVGKIAQAFTGRSGGAATAAATDTWEEF
jgi:methyl-accepting chemotaxis protein